MSTSPQPERSIFQGEMVETSGAERWMQDTSRELDLDEYYIPHAVQHDYHESPKPHRLIGGAAGPGKTLSLIMDQMAGALTFSDPRQSVQVHTLLLRRTHPQLEGSLIPRFREKVPKELYRSYNEQKKIVTWPNGAQTHFGSMQYEMDVWNYQGGQYWKIGFDELTQFTMYQWFTIGAWNRCPVDPNCTKDGATNPIGISAADFACLFGADGKGKRPSPNMDENQRRNYHPDDYEYFPCTYLDNPLYRDDALFLKQLENYTGPVRDALKYGKWGALGTYFDNWDEAIHTIEDRDVKIQPYMPAWLSGDWGFAHWAANHLHAMDERGQVTTFGEFVTNHEEPHQLAESIVKWVKAVRAMRGLDFELEPYMYYSHDAFHQKSSPRTIAVQMNEILQPELGVQVISAGTDKMGGEQLMYSMLDGRLVERVLENEVPYLVPKWRISKECPRLIAVMPQAPRDEKNQETIADFLGDDPLDSARHGIYGKFSGKVKLPIEARVAAKVTAQDPTMRALQARKALQEETRKDEREVLRTRRWRPSIR